MLPIDETHRFGLIAHFDSLRRILSWNQISADTHNHRYTYARAGKTARTVKTRPRSFTNDPTRKTKHVTNSKIVSKDVCCTRSVPLLAPRQNSATRPRYNAAFSAEGIFKVRWGRRSAPRSHVGYHRHDQGLQLQRGPHQCVPPRCLPPLFPPPYLTLPALADILWMWKKSFAVLPLPSSVVVCPPGGGRARAVEVAPEGGPLPGE